MKRFNVPHQDELAEALEVEPEQLKEGAIRLSFEAHGELLVVVADAMGASIQCHWERAGRTLLKLTREGAVDLRVSREGGRTAIDVDFDTEGLKGAVAIQVRPAFGVDDVMLFR